MEETWELCDDSKPYPNHVIAEGSEAEVKALHRKQPEDVAAYIEAPNGTQYDFSEWTQTWEEC